MQLARIERIASRFTLREGSILDREDLVQAGALADLQGRMVRWGIVELIRSIEGGIKRGKRRYFHRMLTGPPIIEMTHGDEKGESRGEEYEFVEARDETEQEELREAVHVAIQSLPEPGRKIFEGRLAGKTLKAIGESCGRTESWACRELMLHTPGFRLLLERAMGWE